jgi:hypothetical protein
MRDIDNHPGLLRIYEAAREPDVSESTPRRWLFREKLAGFKVDGVVRIDSRSIEKLPRTHQYKDVWDARRAEVSRWRRLRGLAD